MHKCKTGHYYTDNYLNQDWEIFHYIVLILTQPNSVNFIILFCLFQNEGEPNIQGLLTTVSASVAFIIISSLFYNMNWKPLSYGFSKGLDRRKNDICLLIGVQNTLSNVVLSCIWF